MRTGTEVCARRDREGIGADLVRRVAVRGDAVGTDDDEIDLAVLHQARGGAVDEHRHRNSGAAELPRGETAALQQWARLVGVDFDFLALLRGDVDRGERGSKAAGRQRTGVAVREHARTVLDEPRAMFADAMTHLAVFDENARGFVDQRGVQRRRIAAMLDDRATHAAERPGEIHRRRPRAADARGGIAHFPADFEPVGLGAVQRERHAHRGGNADRRRAAHGEGEDGIVNVVDGAQIAIDLALRQLALIEDAHAVAVGRPGDRLYNVHPENLLSGASRGASLTSPGGFLTLCKEL
jgi:hypothetical protein